MLLRILNLYCFYSLAGRNSTDIEIRQNIMKSKPVKQLNKYIFNVMCTVFLNVKDSTGHTVDFLWIALDSSGLIFCILREVNIISRKTDSKMN